MKLTKLNENFRKLKDRGYKAEIMDEIEICIEVANRKRVFGQKLIDNHVKRIDELLEETEKILTKK